eukprot:NODE_394_length_9435_cov_0.160347.p7 type:complete len:131 gc:universal NODE_394_length_9435_cov_0.160347:2661-2269(-)
MALLIIKCSLSTFFALLIFTFINILNCWTILGMRSHANSTCSLSLLSGHAAASSNAYFTKSSQFTISNLQSWTIFKRCSGVISLSKECAKLFKVSLILVAACTIVLPSLTHRDVWIFKSLAIFRMVYINM